MTRIGISVALLTPFDATGAIDTALLSAHAVDVMSKGAHGVTLFGTTGEGASVAIAERNPAITALLDRGIAAKHIFIGLCATSLGDTLAQIDQALAHGIDTFLLLPPYYFPAPDDAGTTGRGMRPCLRGPIHGQSSFCTTFHKSPPYRYPLIWSPDCGRISPNGSSRSRTVRAIGITPSAC